MESLIVKLHTEDFEKKFQIVSLQDDKVLIHSEPNFFNNEKKYALMKQNWQ